MMMKKIVLNIANKKIKKYLKQKNLVQRKRKNLGVVDRIYFNRWKEMCFNDLMIIIKI